MIRRPIKSDVRAALGASALKVLLGVAAVWLVGLGVVLVLLLPDDGGPAAEKERPAGPLDCDTLQKRAERCMEELAGLATELAVQQGQDAGESQIALTARQTVVPNLVAGAIRDKKVRRYCRRYWDRRAPSIVKAKKVLAKCWQRTACKPFVACLRKHKGAVLSAL